jgi:hypothetical protein
MLQGSQNLHAVQKESHAQNKQVTAGGFISDTQEIVTAPCPAPTFNTMVRLHFTSWKDYLCHQLCLQRTSQEDNLNY